MSKNFEFVMTLIEEKGQEALKYLNGYKSEPEYKLLYNVRISETEKLRAMSSMAHMLQLEAFITLSQYQEIDDKIEEMIKQIQKIEHPSMEKMLAEKGLLPERIISN